MTDPSGQMRGPPDWVDWLMGAIYQFSSDMLAGFPDAYLNVKKGSTWKRSLPDAGQDGMLYGRMLSQPVALVMMADGTFKIIIGAGVIVAGIGLAGDVWGFCRGNRGGITRCGCVGTKGGR